MITNEQAAKIFEGAEGKPQTAEKGGAYIIKDSNGMRMIQTDAFHQAYQITKMPQNVRSNDSRVN